MLAEVIFCLGAAITALTFALLLLDLNAAGTRNVIRKSFTDVRVFFLLIGIPYLILSLLLVILLLLPKYLFPLQLVLLLSYGYGKKHLSGWIHNILDRQPSLQSSSNKLLSGSQPRPPQNWGCAIRFIIFLAGLALAICGALWVMAYEQDPWIVYPAVIVIGLFLLLARLSGFAHDIRFVSRVFSHEDDE